MGKKIFFPEKAKFSENQKFSEKQKKKPAEAGF